MKFNYRCFLKFLLISFASLFLGKVQSDPFAEVSNNLIELFAQNTYPWDDLIISKFNLSKNSLELMSYKYLSTSVAPLSPNDPISIIESLYNQLKQSFGENSSDVLIQMIRSFLWMYFPNSLVREFINFENDFKNDSTARVLSYGRLVVWHLCPIKSKQRNTGGPLIYTFQAKDSRLGFFQSAER